MEALLASERLCEEEGLGYISLGTNEHPDCSTGVYDEHPGLVWGLRKLHVCGCNYSWPRRSSFKTNNAWEKDATPVGTRDCDPFA